MAAGVNCVLTTTHDVSGPKKFISGRGREAGRPRRPDLGSKVGQVVTSLVFFSWVSY